MTRAEVIKLLGIATMAYPQWQNLAKEQLEGMTTLWHNMLADLPYPVADAALRRHIALSKFPPTISDLREQAAAVIPDESLPSGDAAWAEVLRAMQKVGYARQPQWSHPLIEQTVMHMWGSWANACAAVMTETLGVDRAQFLRMWETLTKRARENRTLPPGLRVLPGGHAPALPERSKSA